MRIFPIIAVVGFSLLFCVAFFLGLPIIFTPIGWLLSAVFLFILPGYLIKETLRLRFDSVWESICISVPISIANLLFFSFIYNLVGTYIHHDFTLISNLFLKTYTEYFAILCSILLIILNSYKDPLKLSIKFPRPTSLILALLICLIPIFSILGAFLLNNGETNALTLGMLYLIGIVVVLLVSFERIVPKHFFAFSLLMISIALMSMYSLRSNYIVGWDIHQEFRVFEVTKQKGLWAMSNANSTYNAMLSITILPTVISTVTHIPDLYIFKLIIPILFSVTPVFVYMISCFFLKKSYSFLAALFFMAQFQFMSQMPALNRQAIAFIFFALILYSFLNKSLTKTQSTFLFVLGSLAMVVSHYSTTYVALGLFITAYVISTLYSLVRFLVGRFTEHELPKQKRILSIWMILFLCLITILWYGFYTQITNDVQSLAYKLTQSMGKVFAEDMKTDQAKYAIWGAGKVYSLPEVTLYNQEISSEYQINKPWAPYYSEDILKKYPVVPMYSQSLIVTNQKLKHLSDQLFEADKKVIKLLMLLGVGGILLALFRKNKENFTLDFAGVNIASFAFLSALSFLPVLSVYYNFERLYQQTLMTLGISFVYCVLLISRHRDKIAKPILLSLIILYLFNFAGFFSQFLGGTANMNLNNFGEEYDRFYTHDAEIVAAKWLDSIADKNAAIYLDRYSVLRFNSATNRESGLFDDLAPGAISQYGYVYSSFSNLTTGIARTNYKNEFIGYSFPSDFLNQNKDLIYNSKEATVYK